MCDLSSVFSSVKGAQMSSDYVVTCYYCYIFQNVIPCRGCSIAHYTSVMHTVHNSV